MPPSDKYPVGHSRTFDETLWFSRNPLAIGGSGQVYKAKTKDGRHYFYKPYTEVEMARDREWLRKKGFRLSDADLDSCFNLWHRESRAYEHIDRYILGPRRSLYPAYYGTAKIPHHRCPAGWRSAYPDPSQVCITVLELFEEPRSREIPIDLSLSISSLEMAKEIYSEMKNHEYIHILIHLCEMLDTLHQTGLIHGDVKWENIIDCSVAEIAVLCDFSHAWVYTAGRPRLDRFRRKPSTFDESSDGEREGLKYTVTEESAQCEANQKLRKKFPSLKDCRRCGAVMKQIVPTYNAGSDFSGPKEKVLVRDLRLLPGMCAEVLGDLLGGAGAPKDIGAKIWGLLNGIDDTEVGKARDVPGQISIEDSYIRLDTFDEVKKEFTMLAGSLVRRMRTDLTQEDTDGNVPTDGDAASLTEASRGKRRWLAHPRTLRVSTRPRPPRNLDGSRARCFNRISRSLPMPTFVFNLTENVELLADKLVSEALIPTFRKMHPEKSGWNLSLVNVAATNMAESATDDKDGIGRDIGRMFRRQDSVLKEWKVEGKDTAPSESVEEKHRKLRQEDGPAVSDAVTRHKGSSETPHDQPGSEGLIELSQDRNTDEGVWDGEELESGSGDICETCGAIMPTFAMAAHSRYHTLPD